MPQTSRQIELASYPVGEIHPTDFEVNEVIIPELQVGEVLVRNAFTSVDPALCLRFRATAPKGYFRSFDLHAPLDGVATVGEVVASRAEDFREGDVVSHAYGFREYSVVNPSTIWLGGLGTLRRLDVSVSPAKLYLGPLGGSGISAYAGLFKAAELREGDVVWVSSAAGSVGSIASQLAKLRGHVVIGSAGSEAKIAYLLDELNLDAAFNYHSGPVAELLADVAPDGIDVYFDNVGGDHLEAAIAALRPWGRVALCGAISEYQSEVAVAGPSNLFLATSNELSLRGFRGSNHFDLRDEVIREIAPLIASGQFHYRETVFEGLEATPQAIVHMLRGDNLGKTLVHTA
jgi:NADPH-dependent curcumin reductase CurA